MIQLFQNLISNAIRYHYEKPPKIHISALKEKDQYLFSVKDNGIEPEHLKRIFTIFNYNNLKVIVWLPPIYDLCSKSKTFT
jgi:light-regulated signal transduction histidine kinase (bacteriophytochrome)